MTRRDYFFPTLTISTLLWIVAAGCSPDRVPDPVPVNRPELASPSLKQISDEQEFNFRIHWPPVDPTNQKYQSRPPLLTGTLFSAIGSINGTPDQLRLWIDVIRPSTEEDRIRWNRQLAFPEYDWMSKVRVWDADHKWIWPNLPFLLRAYGEERTERYGGVDPGKNVDNDFAAVVVRCFDPNGQPWNIESDSPMVSAEWHAPSNTPSHTTTIVHEATSDAFRFNLHQNSAREMQSGTVKIWIIYADFMDSPVPPRWPDQPEFDGGILSYLTVKWSTGEDGKKIESMRCGVPESATQVDWAQWVRDGKPRRLNRP